MRPAEHQSVLTEGTQSAEHDTNQQTWGNDLHKFQIWITLDELPNKVKVHIPVANHYRSRSTAV
jgi:hypothetical protein